MKNTTYNEKPTVLIVDDVPQNLQVLGNMLREHGYKVAAAQNGVIALQYVEKHIPACILMDIMMPELNGIETCRQLKAQEFTRDIPILFITSLTDTEQKLEAFQSGGVDYITKPFQAEEVLARVQTHVKLRNAQQALEAEIVERKKAEDALQQANISKDLFFSILAHDLRSPFTALLGYAEVALENLNAMTPEKMKRYITNIKSSGEAVYALLENLLTWSRIQRGVIDLQPRTFSLALIVKYTVRLFASNAEQKQISLTARIPPNLLIYADENMTHTVLRNLVSNALKFTPAGGRIEIAAQQQDDNHILLTVADTGIGIPEKDLPKLFRIDTKLTTLGTEGERGSGLGLTLCHDLIAQNEGTLDVESHLGEGTTFRVTLPSGQALEEVPLHEKNERQAPQHTVAIPGDPTSVSTVEQLAHALATLPQEWRKELEGAAAALDITHMKDLIEEIRTQNPDVAEALMILMKDYKFDILQDVFTHIARAD